MEFKVSDEIKKELLEELNIEKKVYREYEKIAYEFEGKEEQLERLKSNSLEELKRDIDQLKEKNILSDQLVKFFKAQTDNEIELSEEQIKKIISNISIEGRKANLDIIEDLRQTKKIKLIYLAELVDIENTKQDEIIPLDDEMTDGFKTINQTRSIRNDDEGIELTDRIENNLRKSQIEYRDYRYLTSKYIIGSENFSFEEQSSLLYLYNKGYISKDLLLQTIGKKEFNLSVIKFKTEYEKRRKESLIDWKESIINIIENMPENVSKITKQKMNQLLEVLYNTDNTQYDETEKLINIFNDISNEEWQKYLHEENAILFHETPLSIEGKFNDPIMSTSLIEADYIKTYRNIGLGYRIKPKKIEIALEKDTYVTNSKRDKYVQHVQAIVDLPQNVSSKMKQYGSFSEVDLSDYEIESAFILDPENSEKMEQIKEIAQKQGIDIDTFDGKKFVPIEQYFLNKQISIIKKQILGLRSFHKEIEVLGLKEFSIQEESDKTTIIKILDLIEANIPNNSRENMRKITEFLTSYNNFDQLVEIMNQELQENYNIQINERVNALIKKNKIKQINEQEEDLKKEKLNFIDVIFGKNKLKEVKLEALKLKKEGINLEQFDRNFK